MTERIESLEDAIKALTVQQAETDKILTRLLVKFETHFEDEVKYDQTLRNIDDTLNMIKIELAGQPSVRSREIQVVTERLWDSVRKSDAKLTAFKDAAVGQHREIERTVKSDLRKEVASHLKVIYIFAFMIFSLIGIMYYDIKGDIAINADHITAHILGEK